MAKNRTAMADDVYRYAMEILTHGRFQILADRYYLPSDVANAASNIFKNMIHFDREAGAWVSNHTASPIFTLGVTWEAKNEDPSSLTVSDSRRSFTVRMEQNIFHGFDEVYKDEVRNLIHMMNEAWCLMSNFNHVIL